MKISIHRALGELKLLDSRISKQIGAGAYIGLKKNSAKNEYKTGLTLEKFEAKAKASIQSVNDLIARRKAIKEAIVNSNATTIVTIGGKEMTIASAIERKTSIEYDRELLKALKKQYNFAISTVTKQNDTVESEISQKVDIMLGSEKTKNAEMVNSFSNDYREANGWKVIDPLGLLDIINNLEEEITTFEADVDVVLSESNATTFIEID